MKNSVAKLWFTEKNIKYIRKKRGEGGGDAKRKISQGNKINEEKKKYF